ncbi:MAG: class I SAM-dependent methyltransferase [Acutalibacteraceae bacterium]
MIYNKNIDNGRGFDWGKASALYAQYRDIYPPAFYEKILSLGYCRQGQKVLDLGTGTGVLPRNMVPYGASFVAADISENQIEYAKKLSRGMDIEYIVSPVEELAFPAGTFDVVTACQCFMYFDKEKLLPKLHRFLKDDGHVLILFMAWLPFESEIAAESERLVLKYNPAWTGGGMKRYTLGTPEWLGGLFEVHDRITYTVDVPFTRESWNGRMMACRGIAASLTEEETHRFEQEHRQYLSGVPDSFTIPHYISILDLKKI